MNISEHPSFPFSPMHRGVASFSSLLPVHWELSLRNQDYLARFLELLHSLPHHPVAAAGLSLRDGVLLLSASTFSSPTHRTIAGFGLLLLVGWELSLRDIEIFWEVTSHLVLIPPPHCPVAVSHRQGVRGFH